MKSQVQQQANLFLPFPWWVSSLNAHRLLGVSLSVSQETQKSDIKSCRNIMRPKWIKTFDFPFTRKRTFCFGLADGTGNVHSYKWWKREKRQRGQLPLAKIQETLTPGILYFLLVNISTTEIFMYNTVFCLNFNRPYFFLSCCFFVPHCKNIVRYKNRPLSWKTWKIKIVCIICLQILFITSILVVIWWLVIFM